MLARRLQPPVSDTLYSEKDKNPYTIGSLDASQKPTILRLIVRGCDHYRVGKEDEINTSQILRQMRQQFETEGTIEMP